MKSVKYTLAALAVIALASVSNVKAASDGDVILGVFNSTNSLEFDLGSYSTLTSSLPTGLSWDLGNVTSTAGSGLSFSFAAAATSLSAQGGVTKGDIALAGTNIPTPSAALGTVESTINSVPTNFTTGTAETPLTDGASYTEELLGSTAAGAYAKQDNSTGFGLGTDIDAVWTGNDTADLYLLANGSATEIGQFTTTTTDGDTTLTFTSLSATPEPSAYALGLCAVALFFVLKRRRTVA
jgi:hypothetical protein